MQTPLTVSFSELPTASASSPFKWLFTNLLIKNEGAHKESRISNLDYNVWFMFLGQPEPKIERNLGWTSQWGMRSLQTFKSIAISNQQKSIGVPASATTWNLMKWNAMKWTRMPLSGIFVLRLNTHIPTKKRQLCLVAVFWCSLLLAKDLRILVLQHLRKNTHLAVPAPEAQGGGP